MKTMTPAEVMKLREDFPLLERTIYGKPLIYLDNAATTQTPRSVVEMIEEMYYRHKANVHRGVHTLSQEGTEMMEQTRSRVREFINAESTREVIFTRGATEAINLVATSYGFRLKEGDEIILTQMEHHANIVPWQLLRDRTGIEIKVLPLHSDGSNDMEA